MKVNVTKVWHVKLELPGYEFSFVCNNRFSRIDIQAAVISVLASPDPDPIVKEFIVWGDGTCELHRDTKITTKRLDFVDFFKKG